MSHNQGDKSPQTHNKSRRDFLNKIGLLVGVGTATSLLGGNAISVAMAYTPQQDSTSKAGKLLSQAQLIQLKAICAQVIPKTETLGAAEVDVHGFIDNQLFHCHTTAEQQKVVTLLSNIDKESNAQYQHQFAALTATQQVELLTQIEMGGQSFKQQYRGDFKFLKSLICFGYYTSEVGASQELRYLAVPGGYKGSIPYKKSDADWGSMGLYY
ncbi:gluconate 2-dehydrogenase subunit 3 family protein [Paraglaciecola hydrolytica]|uniref:Twin-arginine translocation pathway signal n=1 Tax=Paraglaciecola hydrolytica TaxID=1799789 RepID=A0A135ZZU1_9ALTE|nr:gluconate 2-dehydrogenase subunit 3 family protein [Paraglaciecola hydrolytica]KXI28482.1 hypothetical protein AX660_15430 [Paraglaciecola hydrolytica]